MTTAVTHASEHSAGGVPVRRRWYRLHLSTWLLLLPAAGVWLLLIVPGEELPGWWENVPPDSWDYGTEMIHGFPAVYLQRMTDATPSDSGGGRLRPWYLADRVVSFRPAALSLDICVGLGVLSVLAVVLEWRRQKRKVYRFTLFELLAITALLAGLLAWWKAERDRNTDLAERLAAC
jgi:hypothetical protein